MTTEPAGCQIDCMEMPGHWDRVAFVAAVGLAAGLICRMPDWNWQGYSTSYTLVHVVDHVAGAFLVGMALAKIV